MLKGRRKTLTGFDLNYWVSLYVHRLSGEAYSRKQKKLVPVWVAYRDVMDTMNTQAEKSKAMAKIKEQVIKKTAMIEAPDEYWDTLTMLDFPTMIERWDEISFQLRGRLIATKRIKAMVETIDAYYEARDAADERGLEEARNEAQNKKTSAKSRRRRGV